MPTCLRLTLLAVATGWSVLGADARADQDENLRRLNRLKSMPLEHRRQLAQNLERFDAMGAADRKAIRVLDGELADQNDHDRERYLAVLRRYHLWLQQLPKERRDEINAAPPEERMTLVTKFRAEEQASVARRRTPLFLQVVDLGDMSPFDVAQWLKIWYKLSLSEREAFERRPRSPRPWRLRFEESLDPSRKIKPPERQFTSAQEEDLVRRMMRKPEYRFGLPDWIREMVMSRENPEATDGAETRKPESRPESRDRPAPSGRNGRMGFNRRALVHGLAGNYHFIEEPPAKVEPSNLFRFLATLPKGIAESYNYLPPEEARRRLTILYRLIYPFPEDMPTTETTSDPPGAPAAEPTGKAGPPLPKPAPDPSVTPPF